jgi:hypothetical protein
MMSVVSLAPPTNHELSSSLPCNEPRERQFQTKHDRSTATPHCPQTRSADRSILQHTCNRDAKIVRLCARAITSQQTGHLQARRPKWSQRRKDHNARFASKLDPGSRFPQLLLVRITIASPPNVTCRCSSTRNRCSTFTPSTASDWHTANQS